MEYEKEKINELSSSIKKKVEKLGSLSPKCCIYRIPPNLRKANKSAFAPCLISIGPLHNTKKKLQPMQEHKLRYLHKFLKRNEKKKLLDYLTFIRELEKEVREYYVEKIELSSKEFNEMVLLDACFLIEFLLIWFFDEADEPDCIFKKPSLEVAIMRDILLLENQLPFFILEGLYRIAFDDDVDSETLMPSFIDLCCQVLVGKKEMMKKFNDDDDSQILHLVDFVRTCYLPTILRDPNEIVVNDNLKFPPGVEMLHDAGIKFEVSKEEESLLNIEFSNGVLRIPRLEMEDHTESLLLNLSAFEQCHYHFDSYLDNLVDYVVLMDILITTTKDVNILMNGGIVMNSLGNTEDLAEVFNTICRGTTYQARGFYYSRLCKQLNAYYETPWHRWRATLKHDYFSNPWTIISVVVAVVLLILTVIQTICTVISM
ncbi:hypothetical protein RDABS01_015800 [Bienertia sinuspersici]